MNQNAKAIFDHIHQKITETTLNFSEFVPARKKSVYFISSFLKIQSILQSVP